MIVSLGRSPISRLESAYRQTAVVMDTLTKRGIAGAGLLDLKQDSQLF
jgi:hypothetical protein